MIRSPADDDRRGDDQRGDRVEGGDAGDLDQGEADEDAGRGQRVGAQVGGVALQRRRVVRPRLAVEDAETTRLASDREPDHGDADAEVSTSAPTTSRRVAS